jgi:hypothetical protein
LSAGDTVSAIVQVSGGAKVVGILGDPTSFDVWFSGQLLF